MAHTLHSPAYNLGDRPRDDNMRPAKLFLLLQAVIVTVESASNLDSDPSRNNGSSTVNVQTNQQLGGFDWVLATKNGETAVDAGTSPTPAPGRNHFDLPSVVQTPSVDRRSLQATPPFPATCPTVPNEVRCGPEANSCALIPTIPNLIDCGSW